MSKTPPGDPRGALGRPWGIINFNENVQMHFMFYRRILEVHVRGAHGIRVIHLIYSWTRWSATAALEGQGSTYMWNLAKTLATKHYHWEP